MPDDAGAPFAAQLSADTQAAPVVIASRCAWTLYNFRRNLMGRLAGGRPVIAVGAELDGFGERLRREGFDFRPLPVPLHGLDPLGDIKLFVSFHALFRRQRPQVAHFFTIKPVIYGTLAAAAAGVPLRVCTVTGLGHAFTDGAPLVRALAETLYRLALAKAHVVFFQNEEDLALFLDRRLVSARKARLVPGSGVDLARFAPRPFRPGLPGRPLRFLMLSRLLKEKGVMEFVAAADRLRADGLAADFRLVGALDSRNPTGLTPAQLEALRRSAVVWTGAADDVRPEIEAADVIVLPSYREGTPRALLEAMAMGRPVIATDAPGCRELARPGVTGERIAPRSAEALAEAARRFIADPGRLASMGAAARALVEARYDEAVVIDRTLQAYREVA
jgi:glycosyltransferase involved in cell wall biosynthesis